MRDPNTYTSPEYPVLRTVRRRSESEVVAGEQGSPALLSLGLLVRGIPSFLATVPVAEEEVEGILRSLDQGSVRVSATGISVDREAIGEAAGSPPEPWKGEPTDPPLPAAFLSILCADGRRIGLARIVSRERNTAPDQVARFVIDQIGRGVQIPDLASTS